MSRNIYDNWEKLVVAVVRREDYWRMCHDHSRNTSISSSISSDFGPSSRFSDHTYLSDEGPGIENFQIVGKVKPGNPLVGCGYPVRGTFLCMFQWVRHNPDGTMQYIEGATDPEYIVTADDVDRLIAVECIPMDEKGEQGELVRIFANDPNKITCDEGPGIENFQIIGKAKPGNPLLGCGYPVRGTFLCMFQWVRHNPDGTIQYIEGATSPEYIVTADDVDRLVSVECIPMDEKGQQGELVRIFANEQNKITRGWWQLCLRGFSIMCL